MEMDNLEFFLQNGAAAIAGLLMGLERKLKGKPAGLKTNMLVAIGACTFVTVSLLFKDVAATDMTRIVGQIVVGVGFLGAGIIMHRDGDQKVIGLATAATIWSSAAAGCLAGFGLYFPLLIFTIFVVIINLVFGYLSSKMKDHS